MVPGKRETWAPHKVSGYYIGNAPQHYQCHDIYILDTKGTRTCEPVFFKYKYLTMPTLTTADALIQAADSLTEAIDRVNPKPGMTRDAIDQLISIFKAQAEKEKDAVTAQRVAKSGHKLKGCVMRTQRHHHQWRRYDSKSTSIRR